MADPREAQPGQFEEGGRTAKSLQHKDVSLQHRDTSLQHKGEGLQHSQPAANEQDKLESIAAEVRDKSRVARGTVVSVVLELCSVKYLTRRELARLLGRREDTIRNHYLNPLVKTGELLLKYPESPNHPEQAYRTAT